jgi:TonB family protein
MHLPSAESPVSPKQPAEFKNSGREFSTYLPARPFKQVLPNTRILWSSSLSGSTNVEIEVRIDQEGRVTDAHVVNNASTDNGVFASAALAAAKQWIFLPAKMKGQSVPSGHIIKFHFRQQVGQQ